MAKNEHPTEEESLQIFENALASRPTAFNSRWQEEHIDIVLRMLLSTFNRAIIKHYCIVDLIIIHGDRDRGSKRKILLQWAKRFQPLTDQELKEDWGL
jgi:hypothetical protein